MKNIIILGAGFSGIHCAKVLSKKLSAKNINILLIDKNPYSTLLPSLPDYIAGKVKKDNLNRDIDKIVPAGVQVIKDKIERIDPRQRVLSGKRDYTYDYLVIASGSKTFIPGFISRDSAKMEHIYSLSNFQDAEEIKLNFKEYISKNPEGEVVVIGGGYTGMELLFALKDISESEKRQISFKIVERGEVILPALKSNQRDYIYDYFEKNNVQLLEGVELKGVRDGAVFLSDGTTIKNPFFIWSAGSGSSLSAMETPFKLERDGRLRVDSFLRVEGFENIYAVGDSSAISDGHVILRKAVNFAIYSGRHAAKNIIKQIKNSRISPFKPVDPGWIIPLGGISIGVLFNRLFIKGKIGIKLHYLMCGYRSYNFKTRLSYFLKLFFIKRGL